jgi:hypothetical protein
VPRWSAEPNHGPQVVAAFQVHLVAAASVLSLSAAVDRRLVRTTVGRVATRYGAG